MGAGRCPAGLVAVGHGPVVGPAQVGQARLQPGRVQRGRQQLGWPAQQDPARVEQYRPYRRLRGHVGHRRGRAPTATPSPSPSPERAAAGRGATSNTLGAEGTGPPKALTSVAARAPVALRPRVVLIIWTWLRPSRLAR